jgi:hypothetical protein
MDMVARKLRVHANRFSSYSSRTPCLAIYVEMSNFSAHFRIHKIRDFVVRKRDYKRRMPSSGMLRPVALLGLYIIL